MVIQWDEFHDLIYAVSQFEESNIKEIIDWKQYYEGRKSRILTRDNILHSISHNQSTINLVPKFNAVKSRDSGMQKTQAYSHSNSGSLLQSPLKDKQNFTFNEEQYDSYLTSAHCGNQSTAVVSGTRLISEMMKKTNESERKLDSHETHRLTNYNFVNSKANPEHSKSLNLHNDSEQSQAQAPTFFKIQNVKGEFISESGCFPVSAGKRINLQKG